MTQDQLKSLYTDLLSGRFSFISAGEHKIHDIYALVKSEYPDFRDDSYLCSQNCQNGHNRPEWQHRVRAALEFLKRRLQVVKKGGHGRWIFHESQWAAAEVLASDFRRPSNRRIETKVSRVVRTTALAMRIKRLYEHRCQICDLPIELPDGSNYAEAHHLKPLGTPHDGPDSADNIIVLCPNHHALCDLGAISLDLSTLSSHKDHAISSEFVAYHNNTICARWAHNEDELER